MSKFRRRLMMSIGGGKEYIQFADPAVEAICVANWSSDGIGLTLADAAAVTNSNFTTQFRGNTSITSFDELQYFTGLTTIYGNSSSPYGAFAGCTALTKITIPKNVSSIGIRAFQNTGVKEITFDNVNNRISFGNNSFNTTSVTRVNISNLYNWARNTSTNAGDTIMYNAGSGYQLYLNGTLVETLDFTGSGVTAVEKTAFMHARSIKTIIFPSSLTSLGTYAFYDCGLTGSLEVPSTVTSIGNYAFSLNASIKNLTFNKSINALVYASNQNSGWTGNGTGTLLVRGNLTHNTQYYQRQRFRHFVITGNLTLSGKALLNSASGNFKSVRVGGNFTGSTGAGGILGAAQAGNVFEFLEVMGTVTNSFSGTTGYKPTHNCVLHFGYNGIVTSTPANVWADVSYVQKIYVGDGSSQAADQAVLDLYLADSAWSAYSSKLDLWYNYNGDYKTS